ncbi:MAG: endonuclease/exonuclease/phosphatase family protein [Clostridia bacterium]|nr:endonuclease/exonuclease/phosphatase family protein [Clostridia bacterium]
MAQLKVMSFNMRWSGAKDGINCFENRKPKILAMLEREDPDLIGFQEITPEMRRWLVEVLGDYFLVGGGRTATYGGESALVGFKKAKMQLISADTVMLSSNPKVQGSFYEGSDQSPCPRCYTKVFFKHDEIDEPFWFYNVHTDHVGALARLLASTQMLQDINSHQDKFFLTGDLNASPDAPEIQMFTAQSRIKDATALLGGTCHGYGRHIREGNFGLNAKIDYILVGGEIEVKEASVVTEAPEDGIYYSDHFAVTAIVEM